MGPFDDTKLQHFQTPLAASGRLAHRNGIYLKVTQISQIDTDSMRSHCGKAAESICVICEICVTKFVSHYSGRSIQ